MMSTSVEYVSVYSKLDHEVDVVIVCKIIELGEGR